MVNNWRSELFNSSDWQIFDKPKVFVTILELLQINQFILSMFSQNLCLINVRKWKIVAVEQHITFFEILFGPDASFLMMGQSFTGYFIFIICISFHSELSFASVVVRKLRKFSMVSFISPHIVDFFWFK